MIVGIKRDEEMPIGYCFSYPAESVLSGDAKLLRWTKGVDIKEMVGQLVGKPLLDYLNEHCKIKFTGIKVNAARKSKVDDNTAKMQSIKQLGV